VLLRKEAETASVMAQSMQRLWVFRHVVGKTICLTMYAGRGTFRADGFCSAGAIFMFLASGECWSRIILAKIFRIALFYELWPIKYLLLINGFRSFVFVFSSSSVANFV
jgi:hypothetical protein